MNCRPRRLRRVQLAVPGSSEKMLRKAAASPADHVFCDLEDAVAPGAKLSARNTVVWALNTLAWGGKTRCVRVNDVSTAWCHDDIIMVVERAGDNLDTILLPKVRDAADVIFVDRLLDQLEKKMSRTREIGIEVLIEEAVGLQSVEAIAASSPRLECMVFGMGDYSASQGLDPRALNAGSDYPGDIFHYARFRISMAAHAAGIDAVDGPLPDFKNEAAFRSEAFRARALGMVGKWAIHPTQIAPALEIFSPTDAEVAHARRIEAEYHKADAKGLGSVQVDGVMVDLAVYRLAQKTLERAALIGM